jgi:hypothetical protein
MKRTRFQLLRSCCVSAHVLAQFRHSSLWSLAYAPGLSMQTKKFARSASRRALQGCLQAQCATQSTCCTVLTLAIHAVLCVTTLPPGGSPTGGLSSGGSTSLCCPTGLAVADADYQQLQLSLQLAQEQRNLLLAERNALSGLNQQLMALALAGTPDGIVAGGDAGQEQDTGASRDSTGQEQQEQQVVGSISSTGVATRGSGLRRALSAEVRPSCIHRKQSTCKPGQTSSCTACCNSRTACIAHTCT